jgi:hypothetical protein
VPVCGRCEAHPDERPTRDDDPLVDRVEQIGLLLAYDWVREQLDRFRVQILNTVGATRDAYTRVQEQTTVPETVTVQLRQNARAATKDRNGDDLPRYGSHVFADADGESDLSSGDSVASTDSLL